MTFDAVLDRALRDKVRKSRVPLAPVDGTGLESRLVSRYYVKGRPRTGTCTQHTTYSKCPMVFLVADRRTQLVLAAVPGRGPASNLVRFKEALGQAAGRARIGTLPADADFDGEWVHEHVRSYGIRTVIPPERGRPAQEPPAGKWRRMKQRFDKRRYAQRWQVETVNSMIKRRPGLVLRARIYWSQCREIILRVITHIVMTVLRVRVFYKAGGGGFNASPVGVHPEDRYAGPSPCPTCPASTGLVPIAPTSAGGSQESDPGRSLRPRGVEAHASLPDPQGPQPGVAETRPAAWGPCDILRGSFAPGGMSSIGLLYRIGVDTILTGRAAAV